VSGVRSTLPSKSNVVSFVRAGAGYAADTSGEMTQKKTAKNVLARV
jgi:hypothetical protein